MSALPGGGGALVPCTCGELVQGTLEGEPSLVSCPIDRFSRVVVRVGPGVGSENAESHPKARRAAAAILDRLGHRGVPFSLEVSCPLPPSKGFGTSTADVVGAITAAAAAVGARLSVGEVAGLAVAVEPSDATMFPGLALFAHRTGARWEVLGPVPDMVVVVLEFDGAVDTLEYNAGLDLGRLRSLAGDHARAFDLLKRGLRAGRPDLVGEAATASACLNQSLLLKPELEPALALGRDMGALGVCAAHSGTALGVLFGPGETERAERLAAVAPGRLGGVRGAWVSRMVGGGARACRISPDESELSNLSDTSDLVRKGERSLDTAGRGHGGHWAVG